MIIVSAFFVVALASIAAVSADEDQAPSFYPTVLYNDLPESLNVSTEVDPRPFPSWTYYEPSTFVEWNELASTSLRVAANATVDDAIDADLVIIGLFSPANTSDEVLTDFANELDGYLGGALTELVYESDGKLPNLGSISDIVRIFADGIVQRYAILGLGPVPEGQSEDPFQAMGYTLGKAVADSCTGPKGLQICHLVLPEVLAEDEQVMTDFSTAFHRAFYSDNRYRTGDNVKIIGEDLEAVVLFSDGPSVASDTVIEAGRDITAGLYLTMDLVNSPHNVLNSLAFVDSAKRIVEESNGRLQIDVLGVEECEALGMGAFLGVARASETGPYFIHITYSPPSGVVNKRLGVVGKGIMFDSGGYNIKTSGMARMKYDMAGAATAFGAARAIAQLEPEGVEVHFVTAAVENMINERAYLPSDIVTAMNGKTIEVGNADAEGRVTMADSLVYTDTILECEAIVELSTLTGSVVTALGRDLAALFTNSDDLANELEDAAKATGDALWRLPMYAAYKRHITSTIADLSNIGAEGVGAGAITAALFLQNFVREETKFAHLDIAGVAWDGGASAYGVKLLVEWIRSQ